MRFKADSCGWQRIPIFELAEYVNGRATKPAERVSDGVPVIKIAELTRGLSDRTDRVPAARVQNRHWVRDGDLLFAWSGSVGVHVYRGDPAALNQHIFRVVARPGIDQRFLRYLLEGQMSTFDGFVADKRTTMGHVTVADLKHTEVPVPPIEQQRSIARVLGSLDDRIESSQRIAKALEEIAATLFKALFVDFVDHDEVVESEIGPIPSGWSAVPVSDIATYVNGKAFTKFGNGRGRMVIRIAELRSGPGGSTVYTDHGAERDFRAQQGDILFAWSGSLDVYRWHRNEALINQHIFKVIPHEYPAWFVFRALKHVMPHFQAIAADKATTMGHIKRSDLAGHSIAVPPSDVLAQQDAVHTPLFERALRARVEEESLSCVRDVLLPRLVSGQVGVLTADSEDPSA